MLYVEYGILTDAFWISTGVVSPQDQRVFDRVCVVVPPRAGDVKPEALVQAQRAGVARAHFKRGAPRAEAPRFRQHVFHQRRAVTPTAVLRPQREIVDVDLIEHQPEGAKPGHATVGRTDNVDVADGAILKLPGIHLARPGAGKRLTLDLEDALEIALPFEQLNAEGGHDIHCLSLANSASGRRT